MREQGEEEKDDNSIRLIDVVRFEMGAVRGNILMTASEKNAKIDQLKLLVPKCQDWGGLDAPIEERRFFRDFKHY